MNGGGESSNVDGQQQQQPQQQQEQEQQLLQLQQHRQEQPPPPPPPPPQPALPTTQSRTNTRKRRRTNDDVLTKPQLQRQLNETKILVAERTALLAHETAEKTRLQSTLVTMMDERKTESKHCSERIDAVHKGMNEQLKGLSERVRELHENMDRLVAAVGTLSKSMAVDGSEKVRKSEGGRRSSGKVVVQGYNIVSTPKKT